MQSPRNQTTFNAVAHQGPVLPPHLPRPWSALGALPTELLLKIVSYITQSAHLYRLLRGRQRHRLITTKNMDAVRRLLANGALDIEGEINYLAFEQSWYAFRSKMLFEAICLHDLSMVKLLLEAGASTAECHVDASAALLEMGKLLKQHGAHSKRPNRGATRGGLRP
ncbi:hypothetical protein FN846DRAFT_891139 [Sphaerosporella brunnea]|uniref:Uncharacterized protein n=1 Tax=Sphaerosporella brunnea TaxID=1250544 RepID=A0A5J5EU10_9PEZI|nr:hypothetical protein FN846DRAFT_891139 [Sphaerosporella brunnea]